MALPRFAWRSESQHGGTYNIVRHAMANRSPGVMHQHDFAELFWIETGSGIHHVNGETLPVAAGDLVCIRPDDAHGFSSGSSSPGMTLVNVAFRLEDVTALAGQCAGDWPWAPGPLPLHIRLPPRAMERLHAWTEELASPGTTARDRDAFLLDLVRLVARWRTGGAEAGAPPWLREALEIFADPAHLAGGTAHLARLCGRSPEQVNRQIRRWRGVTATELVADLRLEWLARQLRLGDQPIAELATACGLGHLGHCYRRFHQRFQTTPQRYRRDAWQLGG